jgi:hypothetical protein
MVTISGRDKQRTAGRICNSGAGVINSNIWNCNQLRFGQEKYFFSIRILSSAFLAVVVRADGYAAMLSPTTVSGYGFP